MASLNDNHLRRLPTNVDLRRELLQKRAEPNPDRPFFSEEMEAELTPLDRKTAECYTEIEELTDAWERIADELGAA
jgi:hypothetical protein